MISQRRRGTGGTWGNAEHLPRVQYVGEREGTSY